MADLLLIVVVQLVLPLAGLLLLARDPDAGQTASVLAGSLAPLPIRLGGRNIAPNNRGSSVL